MVTGAQNSPAGGRRTRCSRRMIFLLFGDQTEIVHSRCAHIVHDVNNGFVSGASIGAEKHSFVRAVRNLVFDSICELTGVLYQIAAKEYIALPRDRYNQSVFFVGIGHLLRIVYFRQINADVSLQHGSYDHENDQQHQHHVHHWRDVDIGIDLCTFVSY